MTLSRTSGRRQNLLKISVLIIFASILPWHGNVARKILTPSPERTLSFSLSNKDKNEKEIKFTMFLMHWHKFLEGIKKMLIYRSPLIFK